MKESKIKGIAIRYSNEINGKVVDTIKEHNDLFDSKGEVFLGKFGQPAGQKVVDEINKGEKDYYVILVRRSYETKKYIAHKAKVKKAFRSRPETENIPEYYKNSRYVKVWFELTEKLTQLEDEELFRWETTSSKQALINSLVFSMSGFFYVEFNKDKIIVDTVIPTKAGAKRSTKKKSKAGAKKSHAEDAILDADFYDDYSDDSLDDFDF
ncbi:MAG: hypothetical protein HON90_07695 [Halobacteriovoraceae bacterium]|jgi:hypothetical protein|nr:hypothetical protein [Halobacteriovoraceae bacterium]